MHPFTTLTSHLVAIPTENIDTDQIIPARFLKTISKKGLGQNCFADWRYLEDGSPNPDFALNRPEAQGAKILLAGDNFGCGSSREHAPWSLMDWGFRAVISTSFADIFRNNSLKNGLLPIEVDEATHRQLLSLVEEDPATQVTVNLATAGGSARRPFRPLPHRPFQQNLPARRAGPARLPAQAGRAGAGV
jgi:3-isopropylmalate/(R)-2-methylmalate dehydratase small subunit